MSDGCRESGSKTGAPARTPSSGQPLARTRSGQFDAVAGLIAQGPKGRAAQARQQSRGVPADPVRADSRNAGQFGGADRAIVRRALRQPEENSAVVSFVLISRGEQHDIGSANHEKSHAPAMAKRDDQFPEFPAHF